MKGDSVLKMAFDGVLRQFCNKYTYLFYNVKGVV